MTKPRSKEINRARKQLLIFDFAKGTTVEDAHEEQELLRQIGDTFPAKMKYNLKQFYIRDFNLTIDDTDRKWLKDEMEDRTGVKVIRAFVPLAEMFGYATSLRSMTQGRAAYAMEFDHYADVPSNVAEELKGKYTAAREAGESTK